MTIAEIFTALTYILNREFITYIAQKMSTVSPDTNRAGDVTD